MPRSRWLLINLLLVLAPAALAGQTAGGTSPRPKPEGPGPSPATPRTRSSQGPQAAQEPRAQQKPQPRPHGMRVHVDPSRVGMDDGDTVTIRWTKDDVETVRILGIDTPETRHLEHNLPYAQDFGPEARAFARGAFAFADRIELLRSATLDPFGRTLGYVFLDGRNYSVAIVEARLAAESVSHYGDNGLPTEAAAVLRAAEAAGPVPFEPPHLFRARMRELTRWMQERGIEAEK